MHRSIAPPPELPERPAFEELLFSFADPERALKGGFTVPSLSLAVRSRAWAFVRPGTHEQRDALDALSLPAQEVTLADIPAGRRLATLLNLGPEVEQLRVRDFGPWFRGPSGPLQRVLGSALDKFPGPRTAALATAGVAALGLIYQFGTKRMDSLGLSPVLRGTTLGGGLHASVRLHAEPRFQNARADVMARVRLPETLRLPLLAGGIEQIEVGGTVAHTADGLLLDTRWANLRARLSWLELSIGVRSSHAEPYLWMDVETSIQRERFSLRAVFSRQWVTARFRSMATATLRTGPVMSGLFVGVHETVGRTFGLVSMGTF
ncbi:hypothetical protein [Archangium sp.]|uniref:hypothetical protein n=1 Tax=Archangium sp. TaxID=1872627 RepID=UPI002D72555E|nr:hypothetical protein [Archangium sp.]HYO51958.1 hypothetical protein [Archangium sp.]